MMRIEYTAHFLRRMAKYSEVIKEEVYLKTKSFENPDNHERLRVHKLKEKMTGLFSFSVTYKHRIIFEYLDNDVVMFHSIGDHDIYK